jgi:hypothetical protein
MKRMRLHVAVALSLGTLLTGASGCGRAPRESAEGRLASRVKSEFGLSLPCSLAWAETYPDYAAGGVLVGARGDSLPWAWGPGATPPPVPPDAISRDPRAMAAWSDSVVQAIRRRAYVGGKRIADPGATPLAIGSPAESLLIQILWSAVMRDSVSMATHGPQGKGLVAASVVRMLEEQRTRVGKEPPLSPGQAP